MPRLDKPRIYFRHGRWQVDVGRVSGWNHPSPQSLAFAFTRRVNNNGVDPLADD